MKIAAKRLLTNDGWRENQVVTAADGVITEVKNGTSGDLSCEILTPGLFDIHAHGGDGYSTADDDPQGLQTYLNGLARRGVTDILLSSIQVEIPPSFRSAMQAQQEGRLRGAKIQGLHMEGPFLSPNKPGAFLPEQILAPSQESFDRLYGESLDMIRLMTLAPEVEGMGDIIRYLLQKGIHVQLGHTLASYETAADAFSQGADSLCHTFNACTSIHHREPGVVTAALMNDQVYCEAICDLHHLHPAILQMIYRLKGPGKMIAISDSVAPTGLPDGEHVIGGTTYWIIQGTSRVNEGKTLSGGGCFLNQSIKNLISIGIPDTDAYRMSSLTPAQYLGIHRLGKIQPGCEAHLAGWKQHGECQFSLIGEQVTHNH